MWIESHQELLRHPKTLVAADMLGISKVQMIGHLHCLWWWGLDFASPDGCLGTHITARMIAEAAEYNPPIVLPKTGKIGRKTNEKLRENSDEINEKLRENSENFVQTLVKCGGNKAGFLDIKDGIYYLHDWWEYAGKLNTKREKDRVRKSKSRPHKSTGNQAELPLDTPLGIPQDIPRDGAGNRNLTVPNLITTKEIVKESVTTTEKQVDNIFSLYESNIGQLTPMIAEELKSAEKEYPEGWISEAITKSVNHNKRNWKYIEAILKNWQTEGKDNGRTGTHQGHSEAAVSRAKDRTAELEAGWK